MLRLSFNDFQTLVTQDGQWAETKNPSEGIYHSSYSTVFNTPIAQGSAINITIREDITLIKAQLSFKQDTTVDMESFQPQVGFWYCIKGKLNLYRQNVLPRPDSQQHFQLGARDAFFYVTAASSGWMQFEQGKAYQALYLLFSYPSFKQLVGEQLATMPTELSNALGEDNGYFSGFHKLPSQMVALCESLFDNPYEGKSRQFYREAKVIELLAYQIDQLSKPAGEQGSTGLKLTPEEEVRLQDAHDVLLSSLANPPSLLELASQIKMSDYRFKNGFRQLYGITPYRFVADQRLFKARELIQTNQMNVTQAAAAVGYTSLGSFSNSFYEKFGIRPSDL
jgi:AraC-like DNA-binding protein